MSSLLLLVCECFPNPVVIAAKTIPAWSTEKAALWQHTIPRDSVEQLHAFLPNQTVEPPQGYICGKNAVATTHESEHPMMAGPQETYLIPHTALTEILADDSLPLCRPGT